VVLGALDMPDARLVDGSFGSGVPIWLINLFGGRMAAIWVAGAGSPG
jgi:hypothetical protein